jgi:predicted TIM-barrel fold metal-dependent hydrolase
MGKRLPTTGGFEDAAIRVGDMDEEGVDVHLMVPQGANGHPDPDVELGFIQAQNRFLDAVCSQSPRRLKSVLVVTPRRLEASVQEIQRWAGAAWAVGVQPYFPLDYPLDHPDMDPIWKAAADNGLTIVHHSFAWGYPGYRDLWSSPFLGRLASHPWAAMRAMAALFGAGIMDRFPTLKLAVLESGFGWLPFWAKRMDDQVTYMGYVAEGLKHKPSEYLANGRFGCSIVLHEGQDMVRMVNELLGDHILMFGSDYPHAESRFRECADEAIAWEAALGKAALGNLLWDNAVRLFGRP